MWLRVTQHDGTPRLVNMAFVEDVRIGDNNVGSVICFSEAELECLETLDDFAAVLNPLVKPK